MFHMQIHTFVFASGPKPVSSIRYGGWWPCLWCGSWSFMILEVPSNPGHSVILWFYDKPYPEVFLEGWICMCLALECKLTSGSCGLRGSTCFQHIWQVCIILPCADAVRFSYGCLWLSPVGQSHPHCTAFLLVFAFCKGEGLLFWTRMVLSVTDFASPLTVFYLLEVVGKPFSIISFFSHRWIFGWMGCRWYGWAGFFFGCGSLITMTAVSLDRYLKICHLAYGKEEKLH